MRDRRANPKVYPQTAELYDTLQRIIDTGGTFTSDEELETFEHMCDVAIETIGEYEHGTADVEDCEGVTLKQYIAVVTDFLLTYANQEENK